MKRYLIATCALLMISCNNEPSLQKYFVENTENKDFIALDVSPSILNLDQTKLSLEQKEAMKTFEKMNVLAFKANGSNKAEFATERAKVTKILKDEKYQQLMKFGSGKEGASVSFVGEDEHIDEFVLFANKEDAGFAVVRILGKDMNPTSIMTMMTALKNSNINLDQLKPLQEMLEKK
ncbi:hypothetical protein FNO01nite_26860 [Flavobacterium noncentrifugens]|uniref:DUF4252 domain-containing protein n=1 Tax=Flavobacterium noncentrifugens TaxID=1128970 RepID=A0A1G9CFD8_9FLAO|nr:DUF4252 domain-containing protein [Flavobacterium noncentrifugens]GEP52014.1 hypothetical protein FNO01nite_26860 [Flavobacterium noncentrifugens]SDK50360.1 protein of unknown function [Flavobacterium noncentrifugens]